MPMYISEERFEYLVRAAAAQHSKVTGVAVDGFSFTLRLKARRVPYDVWAHYDSATDSWSGHDPYRGGMTLHLVVGEVSRAIQAMAR